MAIVLANTVLSSLGSEYEVDGKVSQSVINLDGATLHATASFKVFVRDCGWLIQTMETNEIGNISQREIGSTNGTEIFECELPLGRFQSPVEVTNVISQSSTNRFSEAMFAVMMSNNIPVGETDSAVVGHLWLMFASQCYWPKRDLDWLTPIYDWHASVAMHGQRRKVRAGWDLLDGPGSLPREVWFMGGWGETNGFYRITGTNVVDKFLIPSGFGFDQFQLGPLNEQTFTHDMTLVKHVDVAVTAVCPGCSLASLIPMPNKSAVIVDRRFDSGTPNRPPSYQNPAEGQWPTLDQSKVLAKVQQAKDLQALQRMDQFRAQAGGQGQARASTRHSRIVFIVMCIFIAIPPVILLFLQRSKKS